MFGAVRVFHALASEDVEFTKKRNNGFEKWLVFGTWSTDWIVSRGADKISIIINYHRVGYQLVVTQLTVTFQDNHLHCYRILWFK